MSYAEFDYNSTETITPFFVGGFFPIPTLFFGFPVYQDGVDEEIEGFVVFLEVLESELDERDVGQVNLTRPAYLVRINPSGMYIYYIQV